MERGSAARPLTFKDTFGDALRVIEEYLERGWTDGLPIVPPTAERVGEFVAASGREASEDLGPVPPRMGRATVEAVAVNAVMAGCRPEYMPVVLAAVEAALAPEFNLNGVQATTHMCSPLILVSGPVVQRLGISAAANCFGHGHRANATIGRALRLVMVNLGGGHPEVGDHSTLGAPSKFTFCIGVDEESPWEPFACEPPHSCLPGSTLKRTLEFVASAMATMAHNVAHMGGQVLVVLSPLNAEGLAREGWTKDDVRRYLYEHARLPITKARARFGETERRAIPERWPVWFTYADETDLVPVVRRPENILIAVAGGRGVAFNAVLPGWGYMGGWAVTRPVRLFQG